MVHPRRAEPLPDPLHGGRAEPLHGPDLLAIGVEVGEVEVQVEPGPGAARRSRRSRSDRLETRAGCGAEDGVQVEGGLGLGDHPERLGLPGAQAVGVAEGGEVGGGGADQVVEPGQVPGVADRDQLAGAGELRGRRVVQPDVPGVLGPGLPVRVLLGGEAGGGVGDRGVDRAGPGRVSRPASRWSTWAAACLESRWVAWASRRAFQAGTASDWTSAQAWGSR
jgi:hypothetical protein